MSVFVALVELSDLSGLPESYLRGLADEKRLPYIYAGRRRMFPEAECLRVLIEIASGDTKPTLAPKVEGGAS